MFEDSPIDRDEQPRVSDSIEMLVDRVFAFAVKLFMPWRWFRSEPSPHEFQSRRSVVSDQARWRLGMFGEVISAKFFQSLEALEMIVGVILDPRRWFNRDSDVDNY